VHKDKKVIIVTARVHPGESNSSYVMKGFIDHLLSDTREARVIRRNYIVKIIPMLNVDGVIYGSYRCSLLGVDLNRRWSNPSRIIHPSIYYTKKMMRVISESHEITYYVDMHGHSRKRNVFMYGCCVPSNEIVDIKKNVIGKMVPILMSQKLNFFSFKDSNFRIEKSRETTARVVAYRELGINNSYTMETSFFGPGPGVTLE
jgi:hypothetical protein